MEEELQGGQFMHEQEAEWEAEQQDEPETDAAVSKAAKPPRPARCKRFARARFAEALPRIMAKLLYEVEQGSVPHLKVVLELTGLDKAEVDPPKGKRRGKSLEKVLLDRWHKDAEEDTARAAKEAEKEAAEDAAYAAAELAEG